MTTLDDVLEMLEAPVERAEVERYIALQWVRPAQDPEGWHFQEIDIARIRLIRHLTHAIRVNEEGVDVALSLLDQLYGLRSRMQHLTHAITRQPPEIRSAILALMQELEDEPSA